MPGRSLLSAPVSHPLFEIVTTTAGAVSIRNKIVNEIMHNPVGPWVEANALYIHQSRLAERLAEGEGEFVIFDVGLGAAANAIAALSCARSVPHHRPLRMVSFEREMELLRFALDNAEAFAHFGPFQQALSTLLETGRWSEPGIVWELREGDFLDLIDAEPHRAHLIFFDPYSPKVNQDMWTSACFAKLRAKSRDLSEGGADLYTYSQATGIRVALIKAGFDVGYGLPTGLKHQTTQAATSRSLLRAPLDQPWLERYRRSHLRYPYDCRAEDQASVDALVEAYMTRA